jgi:lipopolysaccharide transport system ATP-binding protein
MSDSAIRIQGVSKWFSSHISPRERFFRFFRAKQSQGDRFYALRDIRFSVPAGSALGLLGRNGAGKSTLMQIIAGTMQPSEGQVEAHGRISPLLELGTGFNPEYTGAENVRLNAAVLGFSPSEIREKEQQIADFADIGEFIDRPVRTYSSGMFARLAFSVAIHVDPKILLVDEILAVGDMGFQQKCLNRLREMREEGLTLVFVSHSPDAIKSVCDRAVFLDHGQVIFAGDADVAVDRYLAFMREASNEDQLRHEEAHPWKRPVPRRENLEAQLRYGSGHVQIVRADVLNERGKPQRDFVYGDSVTVEVEIESTIDVADLCVNLLVRDSMGLDLFGTGTFDEKRPPKAMKAGDRQRVSFTFPVVTRIGTYGVALSVTRVSRKDYSDSFLFDQADGVCSYVVSPTPERPVHYKFHVDTQIVAGEVPRVDAVARAG